MKRQKLTIGDYTYIVDYFSADEDLIENPHQEKFCLIKNYDILNDVTIDKDIYFIKVDKLSDDNLIYPLPHSVSTGYSLSSTDFNYNINKDNFNYHIFYLYDTEYKEKSILCDKIRIYFPITNPYLDAILDIENFISDIKFHYFIDDIDNYVRYSETEFSENHNTYSEFIEIYIPSINTLLYDSDIYIKDYNVNSISEKDNVIDPVNENDLNIIINNESYIPYNTLYYPYRILEYSTENEENLHKKSYIKRQKYINNQFYSTFNIILYPYSDVDSESKFIIDNTYSSVTFNLDLSFSLISSIKFPDSTEDENGKYYGVPCIINNFKYYNFSNDSLLDSYLKYNGLSVGDYDSFEDNIEYDNDELFNEDYIDIVKTGFIVQFSKNAEFTDIFFKYSINITNDAIIDNIIFPLNNIFESWDDVPNIIVYRIIYVDKVACNKIISNQIIISNEWYKYLVENDYRPKLKLNNLYKPNMGVIENKENLLFIDKINCNIIKSSNSNDNYSFYKTNSPKVIYKPIFFRTTELQNISIKRNVKQNIGVNLGEYMSKVETFKLTIEDTEYIEYGRNDIYVIFNINSKNITNSSGTYIITNENDDFISDGNWALV